MNRLLTSCNDTIEQVHATTNGGLMVRIKGILGDKKTANGDIIKGVEKGGIPVTSGLR